MTDDQKYLEVLKEIGRIIKEKNDMILITGFRNSDLERKLKDAEKQIFELRKEKQNEVHIDD